MVLQTLTTVSRPQKHYAVVNGKQTTIFATEIEMVQHLKSLGISLTGRKYESRKLIEKCSCMVTWEV